MGYQRLYELPKNLYLTGSPVLIEAGALLKEEESGTLITQLKFKNIRSKRIISLKASVQYLDTAGRALGEAVTASYLDLNTYAGLSFGSQTPVSVPYRDARSFTASVSEVIFADGSSWTDSGEWKPLPVVTTLSDKLGEEQLVKQYRLIKEDAKYVPTTAEDLWFCDCGCWNPKGEDYCYGCNKEIYRFEDIDLDTLNKDKEERVEKEAASRKKINKISGITVLAVIVLIIAISLISSYTEKLGIYSNAISLREEPSSEYSFDSAVESFEELGDFKDSPEQIEITKKAKEEYILAEKYEDAVGFYEVEYYDAAIQQLKELGDYKDSKELLKEVKAAKKEADYQEALDMLEKGEYWNDDAIEAFEALGDYKDAADRLADCELRDAIDDLDFNYFINNYESYTRVMGNEIVKTLVGIKYPINESYKEEGFVIPVTFSSNGTFEGYYDGYYRRYYHDGIWGVNGDMLLYTTSYTREEMMEEPKSFSYFLFKVNEDVYIMCSGDKTTYDSKTKTYKEPDWSKIELILVSEDSPYADFAD